MTAVVFDLDGTLIDSRGDIVAALNQALLKTNRTPLPAPVIMRNVGDGVRLLCARSAKLPEIAPETDGLIEHFLAHYKAHPIDFTRWAPAAVETLEELSTISGIAAHRP